MGIFLVDQELLLDLLLEPESSLNLVFLMDPFGRCTLVLIVFNKVDELRNLMLFKERIVFRALVDAIARDKLVKLSFGACIQLRPGRLLNIIFHNKVYIYY